MKAKLIKADMDDQTDTTDDDKKLLFCKKHQAAGVELLKQKGAKALEATNTDENFDEAKEQRRKEKMNKRLEEMKKSAKKSS